MKSGSSQSLKWDQFSTRKRKKLIVTGANLESPTEIYVDGEKQKKTANDDQSPSTTVVARKAGRFIAPGQTVIIQVKNANTGETSPMVRSFMRRSWSSTVATSITSSEPIRGHRTSVSRNGAEGGPPSLSRSNDSCLQTGTLVTSSTLSTIQN
jgi:hypothetical protein